VLGVTAKATDIEEGRARLMIASSVISFLLIIKIKINQIFFLNTSNTLFLLFNFLSLQVKKTTAKLIHKGSTLTVHWTTMTQVPLIVLYAATC